MKVRLETAELRVSVLVGDMPLGSLGRIVANSTGFVCPIGGVVAWAGTRGVVLGTNYTIRADSNILVQLLKAGDTLVVED